MFYHLEFLSPSPILSGWYPIVPHTGDGTSPLGDKTIQTLKKTPKNQKKYL